MITETINLVAKRFNVTPEDLTGRCRTYEVALARHAAEYVLYFNTQYTLTEIGKHLNRTPWTVSYGWRRIYKLIREDPKLKARIEWIEEEL